MFDLPLCGYVGIPVMLQCLLLPAVKVLENGCGEFCLLLENLTE